MLIDQICARICTDAAATPADRAVSLRAFQDTIAVAFAGWREPVARAAQKYATGTQVPLIDGSRAASAEHAAFVHAVAGHALDYDDVHLVSITHPSVVIVPALMALAPRQARDRSILDAYGVGVSVNIALGRLLGFAHYERGWHATSTIGPLAAAAAGCYLLKLDEATTRSALSLAAAQAAGLQRNFGAMAKPMQAGNGASAAMRAVSLAADGVTGDADVFGPKGFADLYGEGVRDIGTLRADDVHSVSVKLYPCCYAAHRMIAAVQDARATFGTGSIDRIEVEAPFETMNPLRVVDPKSGNEGKFCAAYIIAVALAQGHVGLTDFTDAAVHRPDIRALMARIHISDDAHSGRAAVGLEHGRIVIRLTQGDRRAEGICAAFPGSPEAPPSPQAFDAKIADCAQVYASATGRALTAAEIRRKVAALTSNELLEITA